MPLSPVGLNPRLSRVNPTPATVTVDPARPASFPLTKLVILPEVIPPLTSVTFEFSDAVLIAPEAEKVKLLVLTLTLPFNSNSL